uniref:hypothetical protein n=1 Tax=Thaumasiovibrio occultus TaxID=1891184 RepID=UPI000B357D9B|nr:hypothetical protein [Thaumasiovibrio occultus]
MRHTLVLLALIATPSLALETSSLIDGSWRDAKQQCRQDARLLLQEDFNQVSHLRDEDSVALPGREEFVSRGHFVVGNRRKVHMVCTGKAVGDRGFERIIVDTLRLGDDVYQWHPLTGDYRLTRR